MAMAVLPLSVITTGAGARTVRSATVTAATRASANASSWTSASTRAAGSIALANQTGGNIMGFTYE